MRKVFFLTCPGCRVRVRVWVRLIGRYCYCPLCEHRMIVRAPEPAAILNAPPAVLETLSHNQFADSPT